VEVLAALVFTVGLFAQVLILVVLAWFFTGFLPARARTLSDRQLQIMGFTLTLLGIATQFVPPVLDLFNVKVK
jgi:hypothetical protein